MEVRIRTGRTMPTVRPGPLVLLLAASIAVASCGDGINEGVNEGRAPRGTIDGVVLHTPDSDLATDTTASGGAHLPSPAPDAAFGWSTISAGIQEGHLDVPMDYADPSAGTFSLYVVRHLAQDPARRIGTLLVNPGGPGAGGSDFGLNAGDIYARDLLDRFDIVGWDPRGTGLTEPAVDCVTNDDRYFSIDSSPDTPAEQQLLVSRAQEFAAACQKNNGDRLGHVGTADSARDMDSIRRALGERRISYFGFSYGSELGSTWATMFPDTVRAAVLDGAIDPTVGTLARDLEQAAGFEQELDRLLASCSADRSCPFSNGGHAERAFDRLDALVEAHPVSSRKAGRPPVNQGVLDTAIADSLYDHSSWAELEQSLANLQAGDGSGILALYDDYYGYADGEWDNSAEAFFTIGCLDDPGRVGPDDIASHAAAFAAAAPRLGRSWIAELTFCSVWPVKGPPPQPMTAKGAGPVLVIGTTGDPATPLAATRAMAGALDDGHLLVVTADQHTGYGVNACVDDAVGRYLTDPTVPLPAESSCR